MSEAGIQPKLIVKKGDEKMVGDLSVCVCGGGGYSSNLS